MEPNAENLNEDDKFTGDADEALPGFIRVTDVLDLHGFFPEQVPEIVEAFIENALELQLYELRIVHGKGRSKLKWAVRKVLKLHSNVIYFGDAPPEQGGWGATIVVINP